MIRLSKAEDRQAWIDMNRAFMHFEYEDENVWEDPLSKGNPGEIFDRVLNDPKSPNRIFMIEEEDHIIGFMNTSYFVGVWAHGKVLLLDDFYIDEKYQGKGYGAKALDALEQYIREEGFIRIQLLAENTNPNAIRFYEKLGYDRQIVNFFCKYL